LYDSTALNTSVVSERFKFLLSRTVSCEWANTVAFLLLIFMRMAFIFEYRNVPVLHWHGIQLLCIDIGYVKYSNISYHLKDLLLVMRERERERNYVIIKLRKK